MMKRVFALIFFKHEDELGGPNSFKHKLLKYRCMSTMA